MLKSLLAGYAAQPGRYDELLASPHAPRPHWDAFLRALAARGAGGLGDMLSLMEREVRENGITYNVYATRRAWTGPGRSTRCRCCCLRRNGRPSRRA
jgi:uncharacterized circularly permuted ATP-grasp superfamily protein